MIRGKDSAGRTVWISGQHKLSQFAADMLLLWTPFLFYVFAREKVQLTMAELTRKMWKGQKTREVTGQK